ncbi:MAG TPA: NUDIX domain-containing protein [Phycisphaerae bacterium]|nr:NUDIX domain-containing protein [Phycisphaerae bacterium]
MPDAADGIFLVDVFGEFSPDRLALLWRDEPRPAHAVLDAMVTETWERCRSEAERTGALLFNGRLARYLRHRVEAGRLTIDVGPTEYADFLGTNFHNWRRGAEHGWNLYGNPLGISANAITSDGWLLLGRRSPKVACHAGYVHTFGGTLEADDRRVGGTVDVFESLRRELTEELGLKTADLAEMVCLGLIRDATIRQPELVFDVHVRLARTEVEARFRPDDPDQEHEAIVALRDTPDAALPFIRSAEPIAPIAVGAILIHGRRCFGEGWYAETLREMSLEGKET